MKKVLVIYYSQTGQLTDIMKSTIKPLQKDPNISIDFEEIKPVKPYPFPWSAVEFFDAMPESVQETPCALHPISFDANENYDLIILAYQIWYLSPSIPISSFLQSADAIQVMKNKPVLTVIGCRNMWLMAHEKTKKRLQEIGANLIGNIALVDKTSHLLSVLTVIGWMIYGKKKGFMKILPESGVSNTDITGSERFGKEILNSLESGQFDSLHKNLLALDAVQIDPNLMLLEKRGSKAFKLWARFIGSKGGPGDPNRRGRVKFLLYFLPIGIFIVSPITSVISLIVKALNKKKIKAEIQYYSGVSYRGH